MSGPRMLAARPAALARVEAARAQRDFQSAVQRLRIKERRRCVRLRVPVQLGVLLIMQQLKVCAGERAGALAACTACALMYFLWFGHGAVIEHA